MMKNNTIGTREIHLFLLGTMASKLLLSAVLFVSVLIHTGHGQDIAESIESAGYGEEKLSKVVVVGSVFCDTCLNNEFLETSYFMSGASVALKCSINRKTTLVFAEGKTDEYGDFAVEVPSVFHLDERINRCSVQILGSPEESCNIPSTTASSKLALTSNLNGIRTYSAGSLSYRPKHIPHLCYKEDVFPMIS
eukprot:Gb_35750 [translate_table: standard]